MNANKIVIEDIERIAWMKDNNEVSTDSIKAINKKIYNGIWKLEDLIDYLEDINFKFGAMSIRHPSGTECAVMFYREDRDIPEQKSVFDSEEFGFADSLFIYPKFYTLEID